MQLKGPTVSLDSSHPSTITISAVPDHSAPSLTISADVEAKQVLVTITPPKNPVDKLGQGSKRAPLDICCVIDVSGSMGSAAPIPADPTTNSPAESTGLSVLDVVKHALRTIITTMQEGKNRLSVITLDSVDDMIYRRPYCPCNF